MHPCLIWGRFNLRETLRNSSANPLPKWTLEYTSQTDNSPACDAKEHTGKLLKLTFKVSSQGCTKALLIPLVNTPTSLSSY